MARLVTAHSGLQTGQILLAELDRNECQRLARETKNVSYPGVLGRDNTAVWFAEEASLSGITFQAIEQQRIHALTEPPLYPGAEGAARLVTAAYAQLLFEWMIEF